jgi:hypothetical protein
MVPSLQSQQLTSRLAHGQALLEARSTHCWKVWACQLQTVEICLQSIGDPTQELVSLDANLQATVHLMQEVFTEEKATSGLITVYQMFALRKRQLLATPGLVETSRSTTHLHQTDSTT